MEENKNRYPHNFKQWHDIRIDEYVDNDIKSSEYWNNGETTNFSFVGVLGEGSVYRIVIRSVLTINYTLREVETTPGGGGYDLINTQTGEITIFGKSTSIG